MKPPARRSTSSGSPERLVNRPSHTTGCAPGDDDPFGGSTAEASDLARLAVTSVVLDATLLVLFASDGAGDPTRLDHGHMRCGAAIDIVTGTRRQLCALTGLKPQRH